MPTHPICATYVAQDDPVLPEQAHLVKPLPGRLMKTITHVNTHTVKANAVRAWVMRHGISCISVQYRTSRDHFVQVPRAARSTHARGLPD